VTGRQLINLAINRQSSPRLPVDLGGSITGITRGACAKLCDYLGKPENLQVICKPLQLVEPPESVLQALQIDTRYLRPNFPIENDLDDMYTDAWGVTRQLSSNAYYYDIVDFPLKEGTKRELDRFPWPEPAGKALFTGLRQRAEQLSKSNFAVIADPLVPAIFEPAWYMRGMENLLIDLLDNREYVAQLFETLLEYQIQFFDSFLSEVGSYIQVAMFGDDLGTQKAPMISPQLYREVLKPFHSRLFAFVKTRTDAKIFLHSCGSIEPFIEDLLDAGIDILHPLQPRALNMDHTLLKKKYGNRLCFWGGVDLQESLIGPVEGIREEIELRARTLGKNGGYVVSPAHNIQPDTPPENIVEMYRSAKAYSPNGGTG
jgi:uroporphyrinogen decarboxylase